MDILRKTGPDTWAAKLGVYRIHVRATNGVFTASVRGRHLQDTAIFTATDIHDVARQARAWISLRSGGRH